MVQKKLPLKKTSIEKELQENGHDVAQLLGKIKQEYELGLNYVQPKRKIFLERIKKLGKSYNKTDKIRIFAIDQAIDADISTTFTDGLQVKFASRDGFLHQEQADYLENVALFDLQEGSYQQIKYQVEYDKRWYGIGVRYQSGRDNNKSLPIFNVIDPITCIPDPLPTQTGLFEGQNYRFMGFEYETSIHDLKNARDGGGNLIYRKDDIELLISEWSQIQLEKKSALADAWGYNAPTYDTLIDNFSLGLYYHYTIYRGRKYFFVLTNDRRRILRYYELPAILKEEKKNTDLIVRPFVLEYRKPIRGNFFGESFIDTIEDKVNGLNTFINLMMIKAKKEALGGTMIVNSRLIKNKNALINSSPFERFIFTTQSNEETDLKQAIYELPQSEIKQDVMTMYQMLKGEIDAQTGLDKLQRGIVPDKSMTKAEAQQLQSNANLSTLLSTRIGGWAEQQFRFLRWRAYQQYFSSADEKFIILNANFEGKSFTLKKDKFLTQLSPHIIVGTRADLNSITEKQMQFMTLNVVPQLQNPLIPEVSKKMLLRLFFRFGGLSPNQINFILPYDANERKALEIVSLLNNKIMPKSVFINQNVDLLTIYIYAQKADDSTIKEVFISQLEQLLIQQGLGASMGASMQADGMSQQANAASNIALGQASQGLFSNQGIQNRGFLQSNQSVENG